MDLRLLIASRYVRSPKSHSVINIISTVSMVAMAIPVAALILLLSIFNGLEAMVQEHLRAVDADLRITPTEGTTFSIEHIDSAALHHIEGIGSLSYVLEQNVLAQRGEQRAMITLRGVDQSYTKTLPIAERIIAGTFTTQLDEQNSIVIGQRIAMQLGMQRLSVGEGLQLYSINRQRISSLLPIGGYTRRELPVAGVFAIDEDNGSVAYTSLRMAQQLFNYPNRASSIEISITPDADAEKVAEKIGRRLGEGFEVKTRYESNSIYRLMNLERWGVFLIAMVVMLIASLSIVGTLIMVIIDKQDDISTLRTLGAPQRMIEQIFLWEGGIMSTISLLAGLMLGVGLSLAQQHLSLVTIQTQTLLIEAYPIELRWMDVLLSGVAYIAIALTVINLTVKSVTKTSVTQA